MTLEDHFLNQDNLYFLSIMKNKLDTKAKRGAIVKALAIGSKHRLVEPFKAVLNNLLDQIFEIEDLQKSTDQNLNNIKTLMA
jgi:hypothetical protein